MHSTATLQNPKTRCDTFLYARLLVIAEHNRQRQKLLYREKCRSSHDCWFRLATTVVGMRVVDLRQIYKSFKGGASAQGSDSLDKIGIRKIREDRGLAIIKMLVYLRGTQTWMANSVGWLPQSTPHFTAVMSATISRRLVSSAESIGKRITNAVTAQPHGMVRAVECPRVPQIRKMSKVAVMNTGCAGTASPLR